MTDTQRGRVPRQRRDGDGTGGLLQGSATYEELRARAIALRRQGAEGAKSKPHHPRERVIFINSDPNMITLYLRWLRLLGVEDSKIRFAVSIHESADVRRAEEFWAEHVGIEAGRLMKTSLKKHNPRTVRKNVGQDYRGCLSVRVLQSADLYRRIEGWWCGIVWGGRSPETANRT